MWQWRRKKFPVARKHPRRYWNFRIRVYTIETKGEERLEVSICTDYCYITVRIKSQLYDGGKKKNFLVNLELNSDICLYSPLDVFALYESATLALTWVRISRISELWLLFSAICNRLVSISSTVFPSLSFSSPTHLNKWLYEPTSFLTVPPTNIMSGSCISNKNISLSRSFISSHHSISNSETFEEIEWASGISLFVPLIFPLCNLFL